MGEFITMVNGIEAGELLTNNTQILNTTSNEKISETESETALTRRVNELLDETSLQYVSNNIRNLFNIKAPNNLNCFKSSIETSLKECTIINLRLRVILYIRLSDEDLELAGTDKDKRTDVSKSIKNQLLMLLEYAYQRNWEVVGIFCDEDITGADATRPEWNKSLKFCEFKNTDIYLSKTQSRFARSIEMIEKYIHGMFIEWKIRFIGFVDNIDTDVKGNKKQRQITAMVDEWKLEDQSENTKITLRAKKAAGEWTGSFAPYGYMEDPRDQYHLVIDPVAAKVVGSIYSMYKSGKGYWKIAQYLNEQKIPTPSAYKKMQGLKFVCGRAKNGTLMWTVDTIRKILMNEVYDGTLIQNVRENISYKIKKSRAVPKEKWSIVYHAHERIIDPITSRIVRDKFKTRAKPTKSGEVSIFSQKVYCECCDRAFQRNVYKTGPRGSGKTKAYMQCRTQRKFGTMDMNLCPNRKNIRLEVLEEFVLNKINKVLNEYYDLTSLEESYYKKKVNVNVESTIDVLIKEKELLESKVAESNNTFKLLYEDRKSGLITPEEFISLKRDYSNDIEDVKLRINQITEEMNSIEKNRDQKVFEETIFHKYKQVSQLDKIIIDEFISKIIISEDITGNPEDRIKIKWNLCTEY
ncbi:MAG: recombinase family protein [Bacilli bacterium]|nr:recombinase family protein [Bacilli bacterium]